MYVSGIFMCGTFLWYIYVWYIFVVYICVVYFLWYIYVWYKCDFMLHIARTFEVGRTDTYSHKEIYEFVYICVYGELDFPETYSPSIIVRGFSIQVPIIVCVCV